MYTISNTDKLHPISLSQFFKFSTRQKGIAWQLNDELKYTKPIKKAKYHLQYNYSRMNPIRKQFASNRLRSNVFKDIPPCIIIYYDWSKTKYSSTVIKICRSNEASVIGSPEMILSLLLLLLVKNCAFFHFRASVERRYILPFATSTI